MLLIQHVYYGVNMALMPIGMDSANLTLGMPQASTAGLIPSPHVIATLTLSVPNALGLSNELCNDYFVKVLKGGLTTIIQVLTALGIVIAVIGIIVGGLMRATSWGSDQRVAVSNKAITSSIVGLVIVLLAVALGTAIPNWFGLQNNTCAITPPPQSSQSTQSSTAPTSSTTTSTEQKPAPVSNQQPNQPSNQQPNQSSNQQPNQPSNQQSNQPSSAPIPTPTPTALPAPVPQTDLDLTFREPGQYVDLTSQGTLDWQQWGLGVASDVIRKAGVTPQISNFTFLGKGRVSTDHVSPVNFAWSDGTPVQSMIRSAGAVYITGLTSGFSITVPARAVPRTLRVYVGASQARGVFTASLNGKTRVDASLDMTHDPMKTTANAVYTITYSTNVPGQQLIITFTNMQSSGDTGYVLLEAATLQ